MRGKGGGGQKNFFGGENLQPRKGRSMVRNFDAKYLLDVIFQAHSSQFEAPTDLPMPCHVYYNYPPPPLLGVQFGESDGLD